MACAASRGGPVDAEPGVAEMSGTHRIARRSGDRSTRSCNGHRPPSVPGVGRGVAIQILERNRGLRLESVYMRAFVPSIGVGT